MWPVAFLIALSILIAIYFYSDRGENVIFLKLLGYSLLGGFVFRLNEIPIPVGFIIFLLFFSPKANKAAKIRAACLGLALLFLLPLASDWYFEQPVKVAASGSNLYSLDFNRDWEAIRGKIGTLQQYKLNDFEVSYNPDGGIRRMYYSIIGHRANEYVWYQVKFLPEKQAYSITARKMDRNIYHYGSMLTPDSLFNVLEKLDMRSIVDEENLAWYMLSCNGNYMSASANRPLQFLVEGDQITPIEDSVGGYYITLFGMKQISAESYVSSGSQYYYWFRGY